MLHGRRERRIWSSAVEAYGGRHQQSRARHCRRAPKAEARGRDAGTHIVGPKVLMIPSSGGSPTRHGRFPGTLARRVLARGAGRAALQREASAKQSRRQQRPPSQKGFFGGLPRRGAVQREASAKQSRRQQPSPCQRGSWVCRWRAAWWMIAASCKRRWQPLSAGGWAWCLWARARSGARCAPSP